MPANRLEKFSNRDLRSELRRRRAAWWRANPKFRRVAVACGVVGTVALAGASGAAGEYEYSQYSQQAATQLEYHGGPVQHHPRVELIFWGPTYQTGNQETADYVQGFVRSLQDANYLDGLSQYSDKDGGVTQDVQLRATVFDPSLPQGPIDQAAIEQEINKVSQQNNWHLGPDDDVVLMPDQTAWVDKGDDNFCAYHDVTPGKDGVAYALVPVWPRCLVDNRSNHDPTYVTWSLKQAQQNADTFVLSHELVEMFSDPKLNGWYRNGGENADICRRGNTGLWNGYVVTYYYDNNKRACTAGPDNDPPSPAPPQPAGLGL